MVTKAPKTLFHYCNVTTFFNIIENKSIWLSDIEKSNDTLELSYMKKEYSNYASQAIFDFIGYHITNNIPFDEDKLTALSNVFSEIHTLPISKAWVFCLSEKGDLLSQWRGYADDGYGIAIGFDRKLFEEIVYAFWESRKEEPHLLWLSKMNYSKEDMKKEIETLINPLEFGKCITLEEFAEKITQPLSRVDAMAPFFKDSSFKEEKEWRLAFTSIIGRECNYSKVNRELLVATLGGFSYFPIDKNLVSHLELKFKDLKKAINKIILGPKCKVTIKEMQYYLISKGLLRDMNDKSIEIINSSSSYR